ncbi:MAG: type IX secretion system protein PorQ [Ignavibacteriae bacterium]|nr:type IX secretion system protein PorQ [Ignavibacteriota bacterium]
MISTKKLSFLFLFLIAQVTFLGAQSLSTYNFLKLDVDARSSSMAGSFVSIENDANSIFYNPAGLSTLTEKKASVGFFKYLLDINSGNVAYSQKYKDLGYFGVGIRYINYGSFDKYDEDLVNLGTFGANDIALSLGYANKYKDRFNFGANLKFIYSSYDEYNSSAVALDAGALVQLPEYMMSVGASLLNLGTQLKPYMDTRENLPLDLRLGISKRLEHLPLTVNAGFCRLADNYDKFFDRFKNIIIGGEFNINEFVDLRIGYNNQQRQDLKTGTSIGLAGFSAGLGIKYQERYRLDYSFNSLGKIGSTHRVNIGFNLN